MTNDPKRALASKEAKHTQNGEADNPLNEPQRRPEDGALHENCNMVGAREHLRPGMRRHPARYPFPDAGIRPECGYLFRRR